ncbi:uncharacterized protein OCT59_020477 [Rhizophagus irregularis]|uniref:uncharacterized protein n=1 Tax=Rhizophagus irregularis TaxID=588596 RepID=UPI003324FC07|nr:hypothetical protein OCT59_020477 [Rhizophagus irregularis]
MAQLHDKIIILDVLDSEILKKLHAALPPKKPSLLQGRGFEEFFKELQKRRILHKTRKAGPTGAVRPNFHL